MACVRETPCSVRAKGGAEHLARLALLPDR
jgi:hypothetical protein